MLSALYICYIYSGALQTGFYPGNMETNTIHSVQTAYLEQSDQGPYCLQYRLPYTYEHKQTRMQTTKVVTGG